MTSSADEVWFRDVFEEHRRPLHAHCYRLAGNVADADDLVQETFLRGWRSRAQYERRASIRTWLYRIATNVYLDHRKAAARRTAPVGDPMEWCTDIGPYPDSLLGEDPVRITMPPDPPVFGSDAAAEFLGRPMDWRTFPSAANGRPALICYLRRPGSDQYHAMVVDVLTIENGRIVESNAFVGAHHVAAFGMPATIEQQRSGRRVQAKES
jgi:RNA polymerase sigma factor (sigma-70 family)